jgi:hypothetical protein
VWSIVPARRTPRLRSSRRRRLPISVFVTSVAHWAGRAPAYAAAVALLASLVAALALLAAPAGAGAATYLPPAGKVWHGLTAGSHIGDFERRVGKHPAVWQHFIAWGRSYEYTFQRNRQARSRLMLHLSTAGGQNRRGVISPGAIADGRGDGFLVGLNRRLAAHGRPVYLRLMAEMNNCDNAYAAYDCSGRRRDRDHSAARFKQAWRRVHVILRGGEVTAIDARLRALGLPRLAVRADDALPRPAVALVWAPMTGGSPMISALDPSRYWPGGRWVDWVGTSFYSRFPNFGLLEAFHRRYAVARRKPFAVAEWAMWGRDDPAFARRLFGWVRAHPRVRMVQYNHGDRADGPFRLRRYPRSAAVIRRALASPRFEAWAPEERR